MNVKMLDVHIDNKLNFESYIDIMCKSASDWLNALGGLKSYSGAE